MSDRKRAAAQPAGRRALVAPTILALGVIVLLLGLGAWQLERDRERNRDWLAAQEDGQHPVLGSSDLTQPSAELMWRRVSVNATFSADPMLLSGASEAHRPGFRVMQMGTLFGGERVLIDRGFLAHDGVEDTVGAFAPDGRTVALTGRVRPLHDSSRETPYPKKRGCATVWPPHSRSSMAAKQWYIQTGEAHLEYDWTSLHYALQWFGMAALALAGWSIWLWQALGRRLPWATTEEVSRRHRDEVLAHSRPRSGPRQ